MATTANKAESQRKQRHEETHEETRARREKNTSYEDMEIVWGMISKSPMARRPVFDLSSLRGGTETKVKTFNFLALLRSESEGVEHTHTHSLFRPENPLNVRTKAKGK